MRRTHEAPGAGLDAPDAHHNRGVSGLDALGTPPATPPVAAPNDDAPGLQAEGVRSENQMSEHPDSAAAYADRKALATLAARAKVAGCTLTELSDGGFLLCRWGWAKALPDARAVAAMLGRMGGRA
jgi:hypothetical protein